MSNGQKPLAVQEMCTRRTSNFGTHNVWMPFVLRIIWMQCGSILLSSLSPHHYHHLFDIIYIYNKHSTTKCHCLFERRSDCGHWNNFCLSIEYSFSSIPWKNETNKFQFDQHINCMFAVQMKHTFMLAVLSFVDNSSRSGDFMNFKFHKIE